jgi:TolB protein
MEKILWTEPGNALGLYISAPDGTHQRSFMSSLEPNYNPYFSYDGRWIVFTSERFGSADVFRAHPDGSGLERLTDSAAFDDQGALSPNGQTLAFVSTRDGGTANIWLLDIASHHLRNLTRNRAGNFRPSWSPDGEWIAFSSDRDMRHLRYFHPEGPAWELMQTTTIYIVHPDGSGLKRLTALEGSAGSPRWSPDGRRVIFAQVIDVDAMRHVRNYMSNTPTQIVSVDIYTGAREVHSDGTKNVRSAAFITGTEVGYDVWNFFPRPSVAVHYSSGRKGPDGALTPSWSPDGSLVVFAKDLPMHIGRVDIRRSRDPRYELVGGSAFNEFVSFTRNGEKFVYQPPNSQILKLVRWDGSGALIFDGRRSGITPGVVTLSADGRRVAFAIWKSPRPAEVGQLVVMNTDGSHFRVTTHDAGHNDFPSFAPDGTRLVYRVGGSSERQHTQRGLRILSLADGKITKLTNGWDDFPTWSPRGDRIAFTGFETGDYEIYTIRPDGTELRQLTHTHGNDAHEVWSPDGRWIAFVSSRMGWKDEAMITGDSQPYGEIFVMRADGTGVRQLTDDQWEEVVSGWIPSEQDAGSTHTASLP